MSIATSGVSLTTLLKSPGSNRCPGLGSWFINKSDLIRLGRGV